MPPDPFNRTSVQDLKRNMPLEVHHSHVLKGGAGSGRTVISPETPAPSPKSEGRLDLHGAPPKGNRQISRFPKLLKQRLELF